MGAEDPTRSRTNGEGGYGSEAAASGLEGVLLHLLARFLRRDPDSIDPDRPLQEYGVDSLDAVMLVGDLEDALDVELPATVQWDHPSLRSIAQVLAGCLGEEGVRRAIAGAPAGEVG
jgi:acyl carrier protein